MDSEAIVSCTFDVRVQKTRLFKLSEVLKINFQTSEFLC